MPDATFEDFCELAGAVATLDFPILPRPHWGQDAAYIAFVLDRMAEHNDRLVSALFEISKPDELVDQSDGAWALQALHRCQEQARWALKIGEFEE